MKINRVRQKKLFENQRKECAFFTSAKSAVEYIKANLDSNCEWGGCKNNEWIYDISQMKKTLLDGFRWGEMRGGYLSNDFNIEIINTEN